MKTIHPLGKRVLVVQHKPEEKTVSGIVLPESAQEKPQFEGEVKYIAPEVSKVKIGDFVLFAKYSPDDIRFEGQDYTVLDEDDIIATVK